MNKKVKTCNFFFSVIKKTCGKIFLKIDSLIKDNRCEFFIKYPTSIMFTYGILLFLLRVQGRRNLRYRLGVKKLVKSLNIFFNCNLNSVPHSDTLDNFIKKISFKDLEYILYLMNYNLLREKRIKPGDKLLEKYVMISIDMTRTQKFSSNTTRSGKIIKGLLSQKIKGKEIFYRAVVEAKLLTYSKLSIPFLTEFVQDIDTESDKQDCEIKAAYRLMDKLKKMFPRLKICLLLDGLYPNRTIFEKCKKYNWKYIMTFKEDKIPSLFEKFKEHKIYHEYKDKKKIIEKNKYQRLRYVTELEYDNFYINIVDIREFHYNRNKYFNIFITNLNINNENVFEICKAGRLRWKIEHAFKRQKKGLFNLEHIYSFNFEHTKCYHLFLQIADWIFQFFAYGYTYNGENILYKTHGSLVNFLDKLFISLITETIDINFIFRGWQLRLIAP